MEKSLNIIMDDEMLKLKQALIIDKLWKYC